MELLGLIFLCSVKLVIGVNNGFLNPKLGKPMPALEPLTVDIRIEGSTDKIDYLEHKNGGTYSCNSNYGFSTIIDSTQSTTEFNTDTTTNNTTDTTTDTTTESTTNTISETMTTNRELKGEIIYSAKDVNEYAYVVQVERISPVSKSVILRLNNEDFVKLSRQNGEWVRTDRLTLDISKNFSTDSHKYQIFGTKSSGIFNTVFNERQIPDKDHYTNFIPINGNLFNKIIESYESHDSGESGDSGDSDNSGDSGVRVIWESTDVLECAREVSLYKKDMVKYLAILTNKFNYFLYHWNETKRWINITETRMNLGELKFHFGDEDVKSIEELPGGYSVTLYCLRYCVEFYFPGLKLTNCTVADVFIYNLLENKISLKLRNGQIVPVTPTNNEINLCFRSETRHYPLVTNRHGLPVEVLKVYKDLFYGGAVSLDITEEDSTEYFKVYKKGELKEFRPCKKYRFSKVFDVPSDGKAVLIYAAPSPSEQLNHISFFDGLVEKFLLMFSNKYLLFRFVTGRNKWIDVTESRVNLAELKFYGVNGELDPLEYRIFPTNYNLEIAFKVSCHMVKYKEAVLWSSAEECKRIYKIVIKPLVNRLHILFHNNKIKRFNITNNHVNFVSQDNCIFHKHSQF